MRELNVKEIKDVNGGVLPIIIFVASMDIGLIGTMLIVQSAMGSKK